VTAKPRPKAPREPRTFEGYLAGLDAGKRSALKGLRRAIKSAAPGATECISYGLPTFRLNGKFFVAIGATSKGCSFYLGSTVRVFRDELKGFDTAKGTIRFSAGKPLASSLVRRMVGARVAGNPRFAKRA